MDRELLIDGDILAYEIAYNKQRTMLDQDTGWLMQVVSPVEVGEAIDSYIDNACRLLNAVSYKVAITDSDNNFRKGILDTYKANRRAVDAEKPVALQSVPEYPLGMAKEYLLQNHSALFWPELEADDILSILATQETDKQRVIWSIDKDFEQVGGAWLYNPDKDEEPRLISDEEGDVFLYTQAVAGDKTDGYDGLSGWGMVTAERLFREKDEDGKPTSKAIPIEDMWQKVIDTYEKNNMTEGEALQQIRCAFLLRDGYYDSEDGSIQLWEPPRRNYEDTTDTNDIATG